VATTIDSHDGSSGDPAFRVEQHGIDYIAESERWATARNIGALWGGTSLNVEYFFYGAILMGFGFDFWTAITIIVVGNLSYFVLGVASLQGPEAGTTAFTISRAAFGTRGSRLVAFFNWVTQLGFETEGLILIVGAAIVLFQMAGIHVGSGMKVVLVILAAALQAVMPYLGHATMVKVLRSLIVPFAAIFVVLAIYDFKHGTTNYKNFGANWETWTAGLAFTIALSGLGWTECGNDYTRYLPRETKKSSIIGWIFLATAIPEIIIMSLGALTFTFLSSNAESAAWNGSNPFEALHIQHTMPSWFIAIFMLFAIVQLFAINSMDLYSSGVSLQALGLRLKRYQAVVLDSILACLLTIWAEFQSTFSLYMKEFVGVIIVWIAPWFAIYIVDWLMRKMRYNAAELQRTDSAGIYFVGGAGVNWNAVIAFVVGLVGATTAYSKAPPPINFPFHWMTPISNHYGAFCVANPVGGVCKAGWIGGADFSIWIGMLLAGGLYFILEKMTGHVSSQVARQKELEPQL